VPDVTDKDEDDASRILEDKGFKVKLRHVESEDDPGTVLKQDPDGGEKVEKGTAYTMGGPAATSVTAGRVGPAATEVSKVPCHNPWPCPRPTGRHRRPG
jgi:hypothetical protein